ncbi:MAG: squalene synthase HpnC [Planctomycetota bacterium]
MVNSGTDSASASLLPESASAAPYENFPVLPMVLPRLLRPSFAAVYAFCRVSDDIADAPGVPADVRLSRLAAWRSELEACDRGDPRLPLFETLRATITRHELPIDPFHRLIDAFEQDQTVTRYAAWDDLLTYATRSANPVGELVLRMAGHRDTDSDWPALLRQSDAVCTALQLANFWQDARRDLLELDRIYLPLAECGLSRDWLRDQARETIPSPAVRETFREAIEPLVTRTEAMFASARALPGSVAPSVTRPVWLFLEAGLLVCRRVRAANCETLWRRPAVPRSALVWLVARSLLFGRGSAA